MANYRLPQDTHAAFDDTVRLDAELEQIIAEMHAHERAGTLVGKTKRELQARFDGVIKRDNETFRRMPATTRMLHRNLFDSTGKSSALLLATGLLSPTIAAIALLLVGASGLDAKQLIGTYLIVQPVCLYCGFKYFIVSDRPHLRPPGLGQKLKIEAMLIERAQNQRRIFVQYSAIALALLCATIVLRY